MLQSYNYVKIPRACFYEIPVKLCMSPWWWSPLTGMETVAEAASSWETRDRVVADTPRRRPRTGRLRLSPTPSIPCTCIANFYEQTFIKRHQFLTIMNKLDMDTFGVCLDHFTFLRF